jgi:hypothetical protein
VLIAWAAVLDIQVERAADFASAFATFVKVHGPALPMGVVDPSDRSPRLGCDRRGAAVTLRLAIGASFRLFVSGEAPHVGRTSAQSDCRGGVPNIGRLATGVHYRHMLRLALAAFASTFGLALVTVPVSGCCMIAPCGCVDCDGPEPTESGFFTSDENTSCAEDCDGAVDGTETGTSGTTDTGGDGDGDACAATDQCDECLNSMCQQAFTDCEADTACQPILRCIEDEWSAGGCDFGDCYAMESTTYDALESCVITNCTDACPGSPFLGD